MCPVCLRKLSSYLNFNGDELKYFKNVRDVLSTLSIHKFTDEKQELQLFDQIIDDLTQLYDETRIK